MADGFIQLPADSTGKKLLTEDLGAAGHVQKIEHYEPPTFTTLYDRVVPAANKYMATLFNTTATRLVRVFGVWVYVNQITAVAGIVDELEFKRITARTVGTSVTPVANDSNDTLTAGITASHNDSAVTDGGVLHRFMRATEEQPVAAPATTATTHAQDWLFRMNDPDYSRVWISTPGLKPLTLRQNQGVAVKNITGTIGSISTLIVFTDEPV